MPAPLRGDFWDKVITVDTVELTDGCHLLWGDRVRVLDDSVGGGQVRVSARGRVGLVDAAVLGDDPLLEVYIIDVGQGDGILVVTPEGHQIMIDGGNLSRFQPTKRNAADFVDWKFHKDYRTNRSTATQVNLDVMVCSHADQDHFGGLSDLLGAGAERVGLDTDRTTVERFVHPGLSPRTSGTDGLGQRVDGHFVDLIDDRASAQAAVDGNGVPQLTPRWRTTIERALATQTMAGTPTSFERVSQQTGHLAGFDGTPGSGSGVAISVLGPIETDIGGRPGLADVGNGGENKNGHSVSVRLDYGDRSVLLAGDLNGEAQRALLSYIEALPEPDQTAVRQQWAVDVAKACHHGSHHVDWDFLAMTSPLATIISSGDSNSHDHPRPQLLGATALTSRVVRTGHLVKAPLIYNTEIARSYGFGRTERLIEYNEDQQWGRPSGDEQERLGSTRVGRSRVVLDTDNDDDFSENQPLADALIVDNLVYGLVNIRTDGHRLLFAVRNESDATWQIETLEPADIDTATKYEAAQ